MTLSDIGQPGFARPSASLSDDGQPGSARPSASLDVSASRAVANLGTPANTTHGTAFAERLTSLAAALAEGAWLWRPRPFATTEPPWVARAPEVAAFCLGLDDPTVFALEEGAQFGLAGSASPPYELPAAAPPLLKDWVARLASLTELPMLIGDAHPTDTWMVPARKLAQISSFSNAIGDIDTSEILDWCGGKGHLGRLLGERLRAPVTVLEYEAAYADEARALARRVGVTLTVATCDALSPDVEHHIASLPPDTLAVGLHACGVLGERLLTLATRQGWRHVAHSPCCLHKVPNLKEGHWHPMSLAARQALARHDLAFDHSAMRLATSDEVVARPALRQQRSRENAYRLALDLLLQSHSGATTYTPLGTLPAHLARGDFDTFARSAAALRGLELPPYDAEDALARGMARAKSARRLGLVRSIFRRAIELVVALDRAAFLAEHGYTVDVGLFSPRAITPRNILIRAHTT